MISAKCLAFERAPIFGSHFLFKNNFYACVKYALLFCVVTAVCFSPRSVVSGVRTCHFFYTSLLISFPVVETEIRVTGKVNER